MENGVEEGEGTGPEGGPTLELLATTDLKSCLEGEVSARRGLAVVHGAMEG